MKSFKEFIIESGTHGVPVISIEKYNNDLKMQKTIDEMNRALLQTTSVGFVNPYSALEKVSKITSTYGLNIPRVNALAEPGGRVIIEFQQFGYHTGYIPKFDQMVNGTQSNSGPNPPQELSSDPKHYLYFAYQMNDQSVYECYAVVMNQEDVNGIFESEKLDEIAPKTLGNYIKKASNDLSNKRVDRAYMHDLPMVNVKSYDDLSRKITNRKTGIRGAVDRLTNSDEYKSYNR